jgi:predicted transglutaminase-like cysteine proteinase
MRPGVYGGGQPWRLCRLALAAGIALVSVLEFPSTPALAKSASQIPAVPLLPLHSDLAPSGGTARPIVAWSEFCQRYPSECIVDLAQPAAITLTQAVWNALLDVNQRVNKAIKALSDYNHWGAVDRWDFPEDGYGDCEDYQLLKRKLLREKGLSQRAMRMTVVIDELGEGHAVLMVRTDRGDFILDNRTSAVRAWDQTSYTFVKREGQDSARWVSLGGVISPVATANR